MKQNVIIASTAEVTRPNSTASAVGPMLDPDPCSTLRCPPSPQLTLHHAGEGGGEEEGGGVGRLETHLRKRRWVSVWAAGFYDPSEAEFPPLKPVSTRATELTLELEGEKHLKRSGGGACTVVIGTSGGRQRGVGGVGQGQGR